jgi:hypothetical protein
MTLRFPLHWYHQSQNDLNPSFALEMLFKLDTSLLFIVLV